MAMFTVTSTDDMPGDTGMGDNGTGTLRQAINYANANAGTTINFALGSSTTIKLNSELPLILGTNTVINGTLHGGGNVTIDGGFTTATTGYRVFFVGDAGQESHGTTHATIENLTIQNANARGGAGGSRGGGGAGLGGAIFVSSTAALNVSGVALLNDKATGGSATGTESGGSGGGLGLRLDQIQ